MNIGWIQYHKLKPKERKISQNQKEIHRKLKEERLGQETTNFLQNSTKYKTIKSQEKRELLLSDEIYSLN